MGPRPPIAGVLDMSDAVDAMLERLRPHVAEYMRVGGLYTGFEIHARLSIGTDDWTFNSKGARDDALLEEHRRRKAAKARQLTAVR